MSRVLVDQRRRVGLGHTDRVSSIDTPGVIERVSNLFHGHPALIQGFNTFLPAGYRIETTDNPDPNFITVTTPAGITTQATNGAFIYGPANTKPPLQVEKPAVQIPREPEGAVVSAEILFAARDFVQKVRTRYANHPEVYKQFLGFFTEVDLEGATAAYDKSSVSGLEPLSVACLSAMRATGDVMHKIMSHLKDAPDLMRDFVQFIPDEQVQRDELARIAKVEEARKASETKSKRGGDGHGHSSSAAAVPQKRKRKPADREKEKDAAPAKGSANKVGGESISRETMLIARAEGQSATVERSTVSGIGTTFRGGPAITSPRTSTAATPVVLSTSPTDSLPSSSDTGRAHSTDEFSPRP